jgi:hypothetical protein
MNVRYKIKVFIMQKEAAMQLLEIGEDDLGDGDILRDRYEEKIFDLKAYWLRNPIIPQLFRKRLGDAGMLWKALKTLSVKELPNPAGEKFPPYQAADQLQEMMNTYQHEISAAKMLLSRGYHIDDLEKAVGRMLQVQAALEDMLLEHFKSFVDDPDSYSGQYNAGVKISQPADFQELRKALQLVLSGHAGEEDLYRCHTEVYRVMKARKKA